MKNLVGKRVRVKVESLVSELRAANGWLVDQDVRGVVSAVVGHRVGVTIDGKELWFDDDKLEVTQC